MKVIKVKYGRHIVFVPTMDDFKEMEDRKCFLDSVENVEEIQINDNLDLFPELKSSILLIEDLKEVKEHPEGFKFLACYCNYGDNSWYKEDTCIIWYDNPWDYVDKYIFVLTNNERDVWSSDLFTCITCDREIAQSKGHQLYYRETDYGCICLKCYGEQILKEGIDIEDFLSTGRVHGMFFNHGNYELSTAGFSCLEDHIAMYGDMLPALQARVKEYITNGYKKIVFAYERLSIGGDSGVISVYGKKEEGSSEEGSSEEGSSEEGSSEEGSSEEGSSEEGSSEEGSSEEGSSEERDKKDV